MMAGIPALIAARLSEAPNNLYESLQASINGITYYRRDRLLKSSSLTKATGMERVPPLWTSWLVLYKINKVDSWELARHDEDIGIFTILHLYAFDIHNGPIIGLQESRDEGVCTG